MAKNFAKRILALLVCLAMCVCLAFSTVFIARNSRHQCTHADCDVCRQLEQAEKQIKKLGGTAAVVFVCAVMAKVVCCAVNTITTVCRKNTLIILKTELLN